MVRRPITETHFVNQWIQKSPQTCLSPIKFSTSSYQHISAESSKILNLHLAKRNLLLSVDVWKSDFSLHGAYNVSKPHLIPYFVPSTFLQKLRNSTILNVSGIKYHVVPFPNSNYKGLWDRVLVPVVFGHTKVPLSKTMHSKSLSHNPL